MLDIGDTIVYKEAYDNGRSTSGKIISICFSKVVSVTKYGTLVLHINDQENLITKLELE